MKRITMRIRAPAWLWPGLLFLTAFGTPCFAQAPITNGLVARWTGDGNAKDSAGHFDGQVSGGLRYGAGPTGQAFQFDGGGAAVDFGKSIGNFGTRDFSIAYWMKTDSTNPKEAFLAKRATCDAEFSILEIAIGGNGRPGPGIPNTFFTDGGFKAGSDLPSSRPLNDGRWHHVVWVKESTSSGSITGLIYVDGALDNSKSFPESVDISNQSPLVLGQDVCQCCDGCRPYTGAAAELQIFSHALTAEEVLTLYKAGKADK
jgi:hypothetical protein